MLVGVQDERCLNCGRWNPGMWGFAPTLTRLGRDMGFVPFVTASCVVVYALSVLADFQPSTGIFSIFSPTATGLFVFGGTGQVPVFAYGRWWTVLAASWLHVNLIHIILNMMSVRNVAPIVAEFYGASRMIIIYVIGGVAGFLTSTLWGRYIGIYLQSIPFLHGALMTAGASASIAGLIGAVFYYGHRTGSAHVADQARMWIMSFLFMGFLFPRIDNFAHLGGLAGGYICAKFLDPLYPERLDHFIVAIALLVLSAIAVVVSVILGWPFLSQTA
jgi:rhomboid protease GluP